MITGWHEQLYQSTKIQFRAHSPQLPPALQSGLVFPRRWSFYIGGAIYIWQKQKQNRREAGLGGAGLAVRSWVPTASVLTEQVTRKEEVNPGREGVPAAKSHSRHLCVVTAVYHARVQRPTSWNKR